MSKNNELLFVPKLHGNQVLQLERKFLKVKRVSYKKQQKIIGVIAKILDRINICLVEKLKSLMVNKCFHLATSSYNE